MRNDTLCRLHTNRNVTSDQTKNSCRKDCLQKSKFQENKKGNALGNVEL